MVKETPTGYPTWVDKFYFNDILRKDYDTFKVVRFNVEPLNAKGENYASLMFRVKMTVENPITGLAHRSFVVKTSLPRAGLSTEVLETFNFFPKEIEMYTVYLPAFEKLFKECGEIVTFAPKCFIGTRNPGDLIIMEDLGQAGFRAANRLEGLDFEHTKLTIAKLAQFHAASAVYVEKGNTFDKKYDEGFYNDNLQKIIEPTYETSVAVNKECYKQWKCAKIMQKYEKEIDNLFKHKLYELVKRQESRFNVLCHGDLWCNNVMFKYDENTGKVTECILMDLQVCNYNTPMLDLNYFIYSSVQQGVRMTKVDDIIHYYYLQLVANLKVLGYKKKLPTLLELQKDFLDVSQFGLVTSINTLAIASAPPSEDSDLAAMMNGDEAGQNSMKRIYTNPSYVKVMDELIPYFELKGIIQG